MTRRRVQNLGNLLFSPPPLLSLSPLTAGPYWFTRKPISIDFEYFSHNEGYPWVRAALTLLTVRLKVLAAKGLVDQGLADVFVTGLPFKLSDIDGTQESPNISANKYQSL